jgi:hypothetical protein
MDLENALHLTELALLALMVLLALMALAHYYIPNRNLSTIVIMGLLALLFAAGLVIVLFGGIPDDRYLR